MAAPSPKIDVAKPFCGGTGPGCYELYDFIPLFQSYANAQGMAENLVRPVGYNYGGDNAVNIRKEAILLHQLRTSLDPSVLATVMNHPNAADLWRELLEVMGMLYSIS